MKTPPREDPREEKKGNAKNDEKRTYGGYGDNQPVIRVNEPKTDKKK